MGSSPVARMWPQMCSCGWVSGRDEVCCADKSSHSENKSESEERQVAVDSPQGCPWWKLQTDQKYRLSGQ